jgi:hypothetical protein
LPVEREGMQIKRYTGTGLVVVTLGLAALAMGCGGSSTKATPSEAPTTVRTPTTRTPPTSGSHAKVAPTTTGSGATGSTATPGATSAKPTAAQLAPLQQELEQAGSSLTASGSAIAGADVNQAKGQEGSAP